MEMQWNREPTGADTGHAVGKLKNNLARLLHHLDGIDRKNRTYRKDVVGENGERLRGSKEHPEKPSLVSTGWQFWVEDLFSFLPRLQLDPNFWLLPRSRSD